jgi:hypothetical protein
MVGIGGIILLCGCARHVENAITGGMQMPKKGQKPWNKHQVCDRDASYVPTLEQIRVGASIAQERALQKKRKETTEKTQGNWTKASRRCLRTTVAKIWPT